jgi:hypothetical protein
MNQFYAQSTDEQRCLQSSLDRKPITVAGLTRDGVVSAFTGTVQSVEMGHTTYAGYPLHVTMVLATSG